MDAVLRAAAIYFLLLLLFRIAGKRAVAEVTTFDFVLLLIIAETVQQAMLGEDSSITHAFLLAATLIAINLALSFLKQRSPTLQRWLESEPLVILENGKPLRRRMDREQIDEEEILEAARRLQGLERLDQIKYAVLEPHGGITIIPK